MLLRGSLNRPATSTGGVARVFAGPEGVHPGWRAALYVLLVAVLLVAVAVAAALVLGNGRPAVFSNALKPGFFVRNEVQFLVPALGATWIMAFLEDAPLSAYGLRDGRKFRHFAAGYAAGLAALSLLVVVLLATGHGRLPYGGLNFAGAVYYGLAWCMVCFLVGFTEEFAIRGYLFRVLERGVGFRAAAVATSVLFASLHGYREGETFVAPLDLAVAGLLFCFLIGWTKSLWMAIGFHAAWDYAENFMYGTRDSGIICYGTLMNFLPQGNIYLSGGPTGPEGSIFGLAVLALAGAMLWRVFSRQRI